MMTPYATLQSIYFLAAGLIAGASWIYAGLVAGPERRWTRAFVAGVCTSVGAGVMIFVSFDPQMKAVASGFRGVAVAFYGGAFFLPIFTLLSALRGRKNFALAACAAATLALFVDAAFIEPNRLVVRRESLAIRAWPASAKPFRIVHISDLQTTGACSRNDEALRTVNALEPDLIVVTGDYMAGPFFNVGPAVDAARAFLKGLRARFGVVCVEGHSETKNERSLIFTPDLGVDFLADEMRVYDLGDGRKLRVFGGKVHSPVIEGSSDAEFVDFKPEHRELLSPLDREPAPGEATVVATHVPDVTKRLEGRRVDLHLAGHTHGGQFVLPGLGPPLTLSRLPRSMARGFF